MQTIYCPLCGSEAKEYHQGEIRVYFQCTKCQLVFVQSGDFQTPEEEKSRYDLHQNLPNHKGYRDFLARMLRPMVARVPVGSCGLDFGSGPGSTLNIMFHELGYHMAIYDPFYAPDESVLKREYDFVTATEVVEHLRDPKQGLKQMWRCVKSGGYLGIMTTFVIDRKDFPNWWYKNDGTHICFYSRKTFLWLSNCFKAEPVFDGSGVVIFQKQFRKHHANPDRSRK